MILTSSTKSVGDIIGEGPSCTSDERLPGACWVRSDVPGNFEGGLFFPKDISSLIFKFSTDLASVSGILPACLLLENDADGRGEGPLVILDMDRPHFS